MKAVIRFLFLALICFCLAACATGPTAVQPRNTQTAVSNLEISAAQAQEAQYPRIPQDLAELEQSIEETLSLYHVPGAQVVLVSQNEILWSGSFGIADVASQTPVTEQTRFRIGSISKTFIALAALKLVEEGKLNLDTRLAEAAPEINFDNPWEASHPVRLVNLLEHTAGFTDMRLGDFAYNDPAITLRDGLEVMAHSRQVGWQPGVYFLYSNAGAATAAYMVEKAASQRFEDYVQTAFFNPLQMTSATYFYPSDGLIATSYEMDGITPQAYIHVIARPAGSINATAQDMAHLVQFMLQRGAYQGQQLLNTESLKRMETPTTSLTAQHGAPMGYGLCLENNQYFTTGGGTGFNFLGHTGAIDGFLADYGYLPDEGVGYFFAINAPSSEAMEKITWLVQAYLTKDCTPLRSSPAITLSAAEMEQYAGYYELSIPTLPGYLAALEPIIGLVQAEAEDGKLFVGQVFGAGMELIPVGGGLFRSRAAPAADSVIICHAQGECEMQVMGVNLRSIPTWNALLRLGSAATCALLLVSVLVYAFFWLPRWGLHILRRLPAQTGNSLRLLPLLTVLCVVTMVGLLMSANRSNGMQLALLGHLTVYSGAIFVISLLFAFFSLVSGVQVLRLLRHTNIPLALRIYASLVTLASIISVIYLALQGAIGLRTWL